AYLDLKHLLFVHINDAPGTLPREALTDKDRVLPGTGNFPLASIIRGLRDQGYAGYYSLELFNDDLWATDPFRVAQQAYQSLIEYLGQDEIEG
ncbi:MAG TPA: TIM barrel protein, partial [Chloroflexota bacterium]|nr:TIM barrel protein [Chloroflexota bacterium]